MELQVKTRKRFGERLYMRVRIIAILSVLATLCAGQVIAGGGAFNDERNIDVLHRDWMSWLPDDVPLAALSIPGTHDTMADCPNGCYLRDDLPIDILDQLSVGFPLVDVTDITQTQSLSLMKQLFAGIRYFDIRLWAHYGDRDHKLRIHHGPVDLGYDFDDDVLRIITTFLGWFPSEAVIMKVSDESQRTEIGPWGVDTPRVDSSTISLFERDLRKYGWKQGLASYFWEPSDADMDRFPDLGEVRGKIVIMGGGPSKGFPLDTYGPDRDDYSTVSKGGSNPSSVDAAVARTKIGLEQADQAVSFQKLYSTGLAAQWTWDFNSSGVPRPNRSVKKV
jgi:1-phosphatidylinositol phosphodiesterase